MQSRYHIHVSDRSQELSGDATIQPILKAHVTFEGQDSEMVAIDLYRLMRARYPSYHDITLYREDVSINPTVTLAEKHAFESSGPEKII